MELSNNSKTLFIPLISKATMSEKGIFINDKKAEEIIAKVDNESKNLKISKWLALYMTLRSVVFDNICDNFLKENKDGVVFHIGCGLDSRNTRIKENYYKWYDIDLEPVINLRKKYYEEADNYKMVSSAINEKNWLDIYKDDDTKPVLIIAEGVTMYLSDEELKQFIENAKNKFKKIKFVFDAYSKKACELSKYKNPVNEVNAKITWGIDNPEDFKKLSRGIEFDDIYFIYDEDKINSLKGIEKYIFKHVFTGKISEKINRIYSFDIINRK